MMQRNFKEIASKIESQLEGISRLTESQEKVLSRQEKAVLHSARQFRNTSLLRQDAVKSTRTHRTEHLKTRGKIADGNRHIIESIVTKIDDLRNSILKPPTLATRSNRRIHFIGNSRESVLTPLLLIKDQVRQAILHVSILSSVGI
jgi:hypothetical protein